MKNFRIRGIAVLFFMRKRTLLSESFGQVYSKGCEAAKKISWEHF